MKSTNSAMGNRSIADQRSASQGQPGQASGAQGQVAENYRGRVRKVDPRIFVVQGITTGMPRDEVVAKLQAAGWKSAGGGGSTGIWAKSPDKASREEIRPAAFHPVRRTDLLAISRCPLGEGTAEHVLRGDDGETHAGLSGPKQGTANQQRGSDVDF